MSSVLPPITENEPLARHTSWRIGGPARYYAEPRSPAEAAALVDWASAHGTSVLWVGGGTNLLAGDEGFAGLVARYRAQSWQIAPADDTALVTIDAGAPMAGTARRLGAMGWAGLEWAEGVPGTLGGALFGNAGCYGGDIASVLEAVDLLIGADVVRWSATQMDYSYRSSALKHGLPPDPVVQPLAPPLITAAHLRLRRGDPAALQTRMAAIAAERKGKTPVGSSCGSVFKNPPGQSAGQLIEHAGLKGRRVGGAEISPRHANYIVNLGGASAADILALIDIARVTVARQFGVALELEVRII